MIFLTKKYPQYFYLVVDHEESGNYVNRLNDKLE
jgi:hypothetical protein